MAPKTISIIAHLSRNVKDYIENGVTTALNKVADGEYICPHCLLPRVYHSSYKRGIKELGEEIDIIIVRCKKRCAKGDALLPDFLSPYKQYSINEIEKVMVESETKRVSDIDTAASEATVRRWICQTTEKITAGISVIKALFLEAGAAVSELRLEMSRGIVALEELLDSAPRLVSHSGSTLGLANLWLMTHAPPIHI